jgi:hypothetical protein
MSVSTGFVPLLSGCFEFLQRDPFTIIPEPNYCRGSLIVKKYYPY